MWHAATATPPVRVCGREPEHRRSAPRRHLYVVPAPEQRGHSAPARARVVVAQAAGEPATASDTSAPTVAAARPAAQPAAQPADPGRATAAQLASTAHSRHNTWWKREPIRRQHNGRCSLGRRAYSASIFGRPPGQPVRLRILLPCSGRRMYGAACARGPKRIPQRQPPDLSDAGSGHLSPVPATRHHRDVPPAHSRNRQLSAPEPPTEPAAAEPTAGAAA